MWPVASYPVGQHSYRIFPSLKYILLVSTGLEELEGTLGASHSTLVEMGSHCSYSQGILSSKELVSSADGKSCSFRSYLIVGGHLETVLRAGTPTQGR